MNLIAKHRYLTSQLQVVVGIISLVTPSSEQQTIQVSSIIIHDKYDSATKLNDIALISVRPSNFNHILLHLNVAFNFLAYPTGSLWFCCASTYII
jgi:secreted trypsin-like serine protease